MKKIVLTTTAVLSLLATGATISSVNAASGVPMVKFWSPAANAYVEEPAPGYRDTDLVATDVTLVEKEKHNLEHFLMVMLNLQRLIGEIMLIDKNFLSNLQVLNPTALLHLTVKQLSLKQQIMVSIP